MAKTSKTNKALHAHDNTASSSGGSLSSKVRVGICGLPNVGKSSLFNALARKSQAQAANFPFCTIEPNIAQIAIPDPYLDDLGKLAKSEKTVPATMEFVDVAGLVKGASNGEGLGNKFLANIRECDAIIHLLRSFEDNSVIHVVAGEMNPVEDAETVNNELMLADIAHIERRLGKSNCVGEERDALEMLLPKLRDGIPARSCDLSNSAQISIKSMGLLTLKPVLYAFNVSRQAFLFEREEALAQAAQAILKIRYADTSRDVVTLVSAKMEAKLSLLPIEKELDQLHKHGVDPSMDKDIEEEMSYAALPVLIQKLLGLGTIYTGPGVQSSRSATTKAYVFRLAIPPTAGQFAGKLHGDILNGFIKAEVVQAPTLLQYESFHAARDAGLVKTEGKDHLLENHDVILVKFK